MSSPTDIVLAVDGGGSTTRVLILRTSGAVLARGSGPGSNVFELGVDRARRVIADAAAAAWRQADLPGGKPCAFLSVFAGVAGAGAAEDQRALATALAAEFGVTPANCRVDHDLRIALAGALGGEPGVVIVAGTGSAAYGRNAAGESARAGGWGPVLDDGGSGYWLGLQAMRTVIRVADGRVAATPLVDAVLAHLGARTPRAMLDRLQPAHPERFERHQIAGLAPLVVAAAGAGDAAAGGILDGGAVELADKAAAVLRQLGSVNGRPHPLAAAGGLLEHNPSYFDRVAAVVASRLPGVRMQPARLSPVAGAGLLALELAGTSLAEEVRRSLVSA